MPPTFRSRTISGVSWSLTSQLVRQALTVIVGIVLARLLSPQEFGLVAMVMVIGNFALLIAELGLGAGLVQRREVNEAHFSSVFWLNLLVGLALTGLFAAGAPLVAAFYGEPRLEPLTLALSFLFLLRALTVVPQARLARALDFRGLAIADIAAALIAGGLAIGLALTDHGVWSLVTRLLTAAGASAVLIFILARWRPRPAVSGAALKQLLGFGGSLFASESLGYWSRNLDNLLIGRVLGTAPLGLYSRAYELMLYPLQNVSQAIGRVMFPALSQIQDQPERVKRVHLRVTRVVALLTFPMCLGLLVVAEPFVLALFGEQWRGMIPVLQILCAIGAPQSILTLNGNLYLSQGRADLQLKVGLWLKGLLVVGIVIGVLTGEILGVAACYAGASLLCAYPSFYFAGRLVGLSFLEMLQNLGGVFLCAALMAGAAFAAGRLLLADFAPLTRLLAQIAIGAALYPALILLLRVEAFVDFKTLLLQRLRGRDQ